VLISVVIPAYNEERLLPRALEATRSASAAFAERGWSVETIVCDNNSTDRTTEIARERGARVVFEPVNQIARARNAGAAAATGDWFLFIDADSIPDRELFDEAAGLIDSGRYLYAGALVRFDQDLGILERSLVGFWNLISRTLGFLAGSFILVEANAFREIGGFSLDYYAAEEADLTSRLRRLARRRGKRSAIITKHPLTTSARRFTITSRKNLLTFIARSLINP
jgi:glycosyltransferase involved in cell wall biosynthesis